MMRPGAILLLLFSLPLAAALPPAVDGQPLPSLAPMLERATPAVANIATRGQSRRRYHLLDQQAVDAQLRRGAGAAR